MYRLFPVARNL